LSGQDSVLPYDRDRFSSVVVLCSSMLNSVLKIVGQNAVLSGQDSVLPYDHDGFSSVVVLCSGMLNSFASRLTWVDGKCYNRQKRPLHRQL